MENGGDGIEPFFSRDRFRQSLQTTAEEYFASRPKNEEKLRERRLLLQEHPELRRQIDIERLRHIIPNTFSFKCNPHSSIARDEAIEGSDVDGGLIITETPLDRETQNQCIAELQRQGFNVDSETLRFGISSVFEKSKKKNAPVAPGTLIYLAGFEINKVK